jgi:molybdate transport system permease protein
MTGPDFTPLWISLKLAAVTTLTLLLLALPMAYWLAHSRSRLRPVLESLSALPLVLPPTVLGFYVLMAFGTQSPVGRTWESVFRAPLVFSFEGLVVASCLYSLPFAVLPLRSAVTQLDPSLLETAWTLGASRLGAFVRVVLPNIRYSLITATVLAFAHTLGEFGVVLMVGGNIPGRTQVVSIAIYDHVEALEYRMAHLWSALLLAFSFLVLYVVYGLDRRQGARSWM